VITFGSLFSGIGGLDLGLERAGMKCVWHVEIDKYATKVLEKHWPNTQKFGDIRDCGAHNLAPVDLICGSFPCQDLSCAGRRAGLNGSRSILWTEFARIVCEIRPRWVLAENVPGLLSANDGRFFGKVLGDLASCGYSAEWDCIPAAAVGAPHLRDRLFIVAYPENIQSNKVFVHSQGFSHRESGGEDRITRGHRETESRMGRNANGIATGLDEYRAEKGQWRGNWEAGVPRITNEYIPYRIKRLNVIGNAVVPQVAEYIGRLILQAVGGESSYD